MYEISDIAEELARKIIGLPSHHKEAIKELLEEELQRLHNNGTVIVSSEDPDYE